MDGRLAVASAAGAGGEPPGQLQGGHDHRSRGATPPTSPNFRAWSAATNRPL